MQSTGHNQHIGQQFSISANCRLYSAGGEPGEVVAGYAYYMVP